jgi:putative spermidine/putrescine transport system permease protein
MKPTASHAALPAKFALALAAPALIVILAALVVPLLRVIYLSFITESGSVGLENFLTVLGSPVERHAFVTTVELSACTLVVCVVLGIPYAFAMLVAPARLAILLTLAVTLPFWTALLVRTFTWLVILQRHGLVNVWLWHLGLERAPIALVNNLTGTVIGMTHVLMPVFIFPTYAAMRRVDPALVRAAMSLGATRWQAFRCILLPLAEGGIVSGAVLVLVTSLGFFVTPAILGGGNVHVISGRIERNISSYDDWGTASALSVLLLLLVTAVLMTTRTIAARLAHRNVNARG